LNIGEDAYRLMERLFPICRSLTGDGVRATFDIVSEHIPLTRTEVPTGTQGEVWLRSASEEPTYRYIGAEARTMPGGWESLGDVGWLDDDGYLYLGDRKSDMILTGGANVYPAEVESALQEHPAVRSCAVIGLPDDDLGQRVHALVEPELAVEPGQTDGARQEVDVAELLTFLGARLVRYKVPRSIEIVDQPLRDDAGKVRRSALRAERVEEAPT